MTNAVSLFLACALLALAACDHKPQPAKKHAEPAAPAPTAAPAEAAPAPTPAVTVAAPTAADLATYTSDLTGTGPLTATITTSMGAIHCELFGDKRPVTVANFVGLATGKKAWMSPTGGVVQGKPFYNGLIFHRVIPTFMIQGGDPQGNGNGGPGYDFDNEREPALTHTAGALAMANAGPDTNGSQFYITEAPRPQLDGGNYVVFGQCRELDIVKAIARVPRNESDRPNDAVTISSIEISRGAPAPTKR
ncbi:MAG: peptidylprolyl isomerase [Myxococcales bacterium]|nr:peptidylprolyl isomerase [Myxococcales bacterium]